MATDKSRTEITSADKQQLGFEYQYLYFIVRLLQLLPGEEAGYECLDDVHTVTSKGETIYIQVKHTIEKAADNSRPNLTKLSDDLWKTLSNWSKLISDPTKDRTEKDAQKQFISKSQFVLIVNRNIEKNQVIAKIQELKNREINASDFKAYLDTLKRETTDAAIKNYIDDVKNLSAHSLSAFLAKTEFHNTTSFLFEDVRNGIRSKMVDDEYVDEVLGALYLKLKEDFFSKVRNGEHQVITYEEWWRSYKSAFNIYRTTLLPLRHYDPILPDHLEQQYFVKELIEIGAIDISDGDLSEIAELTEYYLSVELQLDDWNKEGRITNSAIKDFHKEAAVVWKRIHQACHRETRRDIGKDHANALACFDDVMRAKLLLISYDIGLSLSNGEFVKLANDKQIGWKYSWISRGNRYES